MNANETNTPAYNLDVKLHPYGTDQCDCGHSSSDHFSGIGFCYGCRNEIEDQAARYEHDSDYHKNLLVPGFPEKCAGHWSPKLAVALAIQDADILSWPLEDPEVFKEAESYCTGWAFGRLKDMRAKMTDAQLRHPSWSEPKSPDEVRALVVENLEKFVEAKKRKEGSKK